MKPNRHEQLDFISAVYLGTVAYATGLELQERLTEMRHAGQIGNVLLLLEHPRVITLGRRADRGNILASPELLEHRGIEVFESTRGGDVTYHGPGQLVGYPIFDLRSFHRAGEERKILRPVEYVRGIEEALMQTCGEWGVPVGPDPATYRRMGGNQQRSAIANSTDCGGKCGPRAVPFRHPGLRRDATATP